MTHFYSRIQTFSAILVAISCFDFAIMCVKSTYAQNLSLNNSFVVLICAYNLRYLQHLKLQQVCKNIHARARARMLNSMITFSNTCVRSFLDKFFIVITKNSTEMKNMEPIYMSRFIRMHKNDGNSRTSGEILKMITIFNTIFGRPYG